ncbi:hypothetical protein LCGC14_2268670 [marine sediment metagenome]|uniref:Uncharacterized protein n=1 Tax=marine sediment metagenome TaxID=412755 RepID=A0A0F9DJU8_9ZZZZ
MADVPITPVVAAHGGIAAVPQVMAAADNYIVRNNGRVLLFFRKTGAGAATITVVTPKLVSGLAVAELTFNVPATTGEVWAGPFNPDTFNDPSGDLDVSTSEDTGITMDSVQI